MSTGEKPFRIATIILMVLVLLVSWSALNATRQTRQQLQQLQGEMHNLRSQLTHEVGSIRGTMQTFKEESRWYTSPQFEVIGVENGTATVKLSWNLREYTADSIVTLNYRYGDQSSFREIEAVEESSGLFSAIFPIQIAMEPAWHLSVSQVSSGDTKTSRSSSVEVKEEWGAIISPMLLEYYIALQEGETRRTSEQQRMELNKLRYHYFNPIDLKIRWESEGELNVYLREYYFGKPQYELLQSHLESRGANSEVIERWPLNPIKIQLPAGAPAQPAEATTPFEVTAAPAQEYDSLFVVVEYTGGITAEKLISPMQR